MYHFMSSLIIIGTYCMTGNVSAHSLFGWLTTGRPTTVIYFGSGIQTTTTKNSCKMCSDFHPQQEFCDHSGVIKAKILNRVKGSLDYEIEVHNVFKGPDTLKNLRKVINHPTCPTENFTENKIYLITGDIGSDNNDISFVTSSCHWVQPFAELSKRQKRGLRRYYTHGCAECKIEMCSGTDECADKNMQVCKFNKLWDQDVSTCITEKSFCRPVNGQCQWISKDITKTGRIKTINCGYQ